MRNTLSIRRAATVVAVFGAVGLASVSCGDVARTGRSPAYLIIDQIEAASGAEPDTFAGFLLSDVQTGGGVINDWGRATFRLALKNQGTATAPLGPSTTNEITITRYRVRFIRADGRNTPGVDVPYGFDGGMTVTVTANGTSGVFDLVRHANKREPPLINLRGAGAARFINTIAEVTFWGADQAGNDATVSGSVTVNFADFADPLQ